MLINADYQLFLFLNSLHNPFFDEVMYIISGRLIWAPLYLAILIALWYKFRKKFWILLAVIILTIAVSDQLSNLIKKSVKRPRPCYETKLAGQVHTVKGKCGGQYGFVSSHATNSFTVALLSLLLLRRKWFSVFMIVWATAIGYSRIYLGVHYPGDVIFGSILGTLTGLAAWKVYTILIEKYFPGRSPAEPA